MLHPTTAKGAGWALPMRNTTTTALTQKGMEAKRAPPPGQTWAAFHSSISVHFLFSMNKPQVLKKLLTQPYSHVIPPPSPTPLGEFVHAAANAPRDFYLLMGVKPHCSHQP